TMSVVGDGPARDEVKAQFAGLPADRIEWLGAIEPAAVPDVLYSGGIYVWPGCGEAYGVAYLEAQAAGLPVVAQDIAGVPEVVR
ncbi:MAG: glycosyltransferase family 4 protein, partial [Mesorhizobium sp.]